MTTTTSDEVRIPMLADDAKRLAAVLTGIAAGCATDDSRPVLTYFQLSAHAEGYLQIVSADGFRLQIALNKSIVMPEDFNPSYFKPSDLKPLLVALKATRDIDGGQLTIRKTDEGGSALLWESDHRQSTPEERIELLSATNAGTFPNWSQLVCRADYATDITSIGAPLLISTLQFLAAISPDSKTVRFASRKTNANRLDAREGDWIGTVIVMPMFTTQDAYTDNDTLIRGVAEDTCRHRKTDGELCTRTTGLDIDPVSGKVMCWQHRADRQDSQPDTDASQGDTDETDDTRELCLVCLDMKEADDLHLCVDCDILYCEGCHDSHMDTHDDLYPTGTDVTIEDDEDLEDDQRIDDDEDPDADQSEDADEPAEPLPVAAD